MPPWARRGHCVVARAARCWHHRDFRRHEGFRYWPKPGAQAIRPDQAAPRFYAKDTPRLRFLGKTRREEDWTSLEIVTPFTALPAEGKPEFA
jgi:hypothetical protein